jgi:hypothetical protein
MDKCYDATMKRTTVFLPEELHDRLRSEAFAAHVSMAQLIRSRLERGRRPRAAGNSDALEKVEGIVRDGHLSEGIDEALYSS